MALPLAPSPHTPTAPDVVEAPDEDSPDDVLCAVRFRSSGQWCEWEADYRVDVVCPNCGPRSSVICDLHVDWCEDDAVMCLRCAVMAPLTLIAVEPLHY